MSYFLGLDNGGTITKAALFDEHGRDIQTEGRSTPLLRKAGGWDERDMLELWRCNVVCIREVLSKSGISPTDIAGVGCSGHGKGLYLWGKDHKPAGPAIASTDRRARGIVTRWKLDGTAAAAEEQTLQPVTESQPAALLRWIKDNRPEIYNNIQWVFECKDYIRFMLTGTAMAEQSDYSGTSLMNLNTCRFDKHLFDLFGISEAYTAMPPLCLSNDVCGRVTPDAAAETGLIEGTPVCDGMFDIDACSIAMDVL